MPVIPEWVYTLSVAIAYIGLSGATMHAAIRAAALRRQAKETPTLTLLSSLLYLALARMLDSIFWLLLFVILPARFSPAEINSIRPFLYVVWLGIVGVSAWTWLYIHRKALR